MTDFRNEGILNVANIKISPSANKKSPLTQLISTTQTKYQLFRQYASVQLEGFIQEQLQLYQAYFKEQTDCLLDFMNTHFEKLEDEKDSFRRENNQLKAEVDRQKNVIKMMKQEVEDLMILLNSQKLTPKKQISQDCQEQPPRSSTVFNNVGLQIIEEEHTQRTILSSERSQSLIRIQDKEQQPDQQNIYPSKSFEIYGQNHPMNNNSHLKSVLEYEQSNFQGNFPNYSSSKLQPEELLQNNEYQLRKNPEKRVQLMDLSEKFINCERMSRQYEPKTKQFLEEFRKTFNKCLNSAQARKKHSTKTNGKISSNSMHLTFGRSSQSYKAKPRQSSQKVETMIKNLDSNKFAVGNKKLQLRYEGEKKNGQRHGNGTLYFSNGLCYDGEFRQGMRSGNGVLKFNHIQIYNGNWLNDEIEGVGKIRNCAIINKKKSITNSSYLSKWISYNGEFRGSKFEGQGILFLQGGQRFIGRFMGGTAYGQGSIHRKSGEIENGIWENNVLMEEL